MASNGSGDFDSLNHLLDGSNQLLLHGPDLQFTGSQPGNGPPHASNASQGHTMDFVNLNDYFASDISGPFDMQLNLEQSASGISLAQPTTNNSNGHINPQEEANNSTWPYNNNLDLAPEVEGAILHWQPRHTRQPKSKPPSQSDWLRHKAIIYDLYLEQGKTLKETSQIMRDDYAFDTTPNLYKQKFQEWQWVKNIPQHLTPELVRLADKRKPKDTVFQLGSRRWNAVEIRRRMAKLKSRNRRVESPVLPPGLIIRTPSPSPPPSFSSSLLSSSSFSSSISTPPSPLSSPQPSSHSSPSPSPSKLIPQKRSRSPSTNPLGPVKSSQPKLSRTPLRQVSPEVLARRQTPYKQESPDEERHNLFDFSGCTRYESMEELQQQMRYTQSLLSYGLFQSALKETTNVLYGCELLLQPTDPDVVKTMYQQARLLLRNRRDIEAERVLYGMSSNYARESGPRHEKTLNHGIEAFDILSLCSEENDLGVLANRWLWITSPSSELMGRFTISTALHTSLEADITILSTEMVAFDSSLKGIESTASMKGVAALVARLFVLYNDFGALGERGACFFKRCHQLKEAVLRL